MLVRSFCLQRECSTLPSLEPPAKRNIWTGMQNTQAKSTAKNPLKNENSTGGTLIFSYKIHGLGQFEPPQWEGWKMYFLKEAPPLPLVRGPEDVTAADSFSSRASAKVFDYWLCKGQSPIIYPNTYSSKGQEILANSLYVWINWRILDQSVIQQEFTWRL